MSFQSLSLLPVISKPTRITNTSATLIDHIYVADLYKVLPGILVDNISDHMHTFMIDANLFETHSNSSCNTIKYRIVNDASLGRMYEQLSFYDLMSVVRDNNWVVGLDELMKTIQTEYDNHCSIQSKIISNKSMQKLWITGNIISNIKKKQST